MTRIFSIVKMSPCPVIVVIGSQLLVAFGLSPLSADARHFEQVNDVACRSSRCRSAAAAPQHLQAWPGLAQSAEKWRLLYRRLWIALSLGRSLWKMSVSLISSPAFVI